MLFKILAEQLEKEPTAADYIEAIFAARKILSKMKILPTAKIIDNLEPLKKAQAIELLKEKVLNTDRKERILASRILSKLQINSAIPKYLNVLTRENDIYYLIKAISATLPIIQEQKQVFQNPFHQEGDVYEHSKQVSKALIFAIAYFTPTIKAMGINFPPAIKKEVQLVLNSVSDKDIIKKIRNALERDIDGLSIAKLLSLGGFLHDIGKPKTATPKLTKNKDLKLFPLAGGNYIHQKFSEHELVGARHLLAHADILCLTEKQLFFLYDLIKGHKDITDAVKNARKQPADRINALKRSLKEIKTAFQKEDIFYESVLLFLADSVGKVGPNSTPSDISELREAFHLILKI